MLGGPQSPPSIAELCQLPAWLLQDIRYIYSEIGDERERIRLKRKADEQAKKLRKGAKAR